MANWLFMQSITMIADILKVGVNPFPPTADDLDELKITLELMLESLEKDIVDVD